MTPKEFHIWLSGFSAAIDGMPNKKQWAAILEKLATVASEAPLIPSDAPTILQDPPFDYRRIYTVWNTV